LIINVKLYDSPEMETVGKIRLNADLLKELEFLNHALSENADTKMQSLYPEGYVFMNALYGLAWCNVLHQLNEQVPLYKKGHDQIQQAFNKVNSENSRTIFEETLPLPYGSFYNGWNNYLLGSKLSIEQASQRDTVEINQFKQQCEAIALAISRETYPATYYGGVWPADVVLCAASLGMHDRIFEPKYKKTLLRWVKAVKGSLDKNGLIPHSINYKDQKIAEEARGSSQSLILIFLKEIDADFATEEFKIYQSLFIDTRFGLRGVREYPKGNVGAGDIDSGPVVLQMGGAATIVGLQTTSVFDKSEISSTISSTIEALAFPCQNKLEKFYLFGSLPMIDAFVAWSHSNQQTINQRNFFFWEFHIYSLVLSALIIGIIRWLWKKSKPKSHLIVEW